MQFLPSAMFIPKEPVPGTFQYGANTVNSISLVDSGAWKEKSNSIGTLTAFFSAHGSASHPSIRTAVIWALTPGMTIGLSFIVVILILAC